MSQNKELFSLIIQGRLNETSISNIKKYLEHFDKIVISYWDNDNEAVLDKIQDISNIIFVKNSYSEVKESWYNRQNIMRQCITTLRGLQKTNTKYVIKSRSDEYFNGLDLFKNTIIANPDKITTTNLFFLENSDAAFHPSDHFFGGERDWLIQAYSYMYDMLSKNKYPLGLLPKQFPLPCSDYELLFGNAEAVLAFNILRSKNIPFNLSRAKEIMKQTFNVINIKDLEPLRWTSNAYGIYANGNSEPKDLIPFYSPDPL